MGSCSHHTRSALQRASLGQSARMPSMKLRFRLRSLLLIVGLFALACWAYWIGWPWWQLHLEQADFEASIRQIKAGSSQEAARKLVRSKTAVKIIVEPGENAAGELVSYEVYCWKNAYYCICYVPGTVVSQDAYSVPCRRIEVYRLSPPPPDYRSPEGFADGPIAGYICDVHRMLTGQTKE